MDCETMLELLSTSLDGELTPEQETQLQAHLDKYPNCRALLGDLAELHEACGEMEVLPPAQLKEQIMGGLPAQRSSKVIYWKRWGALAATLAIVAMAAWRLPHNFFQEPAAETVIESASVTVVETVEDAAVSANRSSTAGGISDKSASEDALDTPNSGAGAADTQKFEAQSTSLEAGVDSAAAKKFSKTPTLADQPAPAAEAFEDVAVIESRGDMAVNERSVDLDEDILDDSVDSISTTTLEPIVQVPVDFSHYCAVVTLTEGTYEGDFLRQEQDNGDVWYLLPRSILYDDALELRQLLPAYELCLEGEDLTPDAPHVLLIVPAVH